MMFALCMSEEAPTLDSLLKRKDAEDEFTKR